MKLWGLISFSIVCIFSPVVKRCAQAAPMNPNQDPQRTPQFGDPFDYNMAAPITAPYHKDSQQYSWGAPPMSHGNLGYDYAYPGNYPTPAPSMTTWDQRNFGVDHQNLYSTGLAPPQTYNTNDVGNTIDHGIQVGYPYNLNHLINVFTQQVHPGQASSSSSSSLAPTISPIPSAPLTYMNRPYRPPKELNDRHWRLNLFEWQKKYTRKELLKIYWNIAKKWGSLSMATLTKHRYKRINQQLQKDPINIDPILHGNQSIIDSVAGKYTSRSRKVNHTSKGRSPPIMTPEDFVIWITNSNHHGMPLRDRIKEKDRALASLGKEQAPVVIDRLVNCWNSSKEVVQRRLEDITEEDLNPFLPLIQGDDPHHVEQAAHRLRDLIFAKELHRLQS